MMKEKIKTAWKRITKYPFIIGMILILILGNVFWIDKEGVLNTFQPVLAASQKMGESSTDDDSVIISQEKEQAELKENQITESVETLESSDNSNNGIDTIGVTSEGVTRFVKYEPIEVNSPYYTDCGLLALTTEYDYTTVDDSYFEDAAFVGDSRMLGLFDYAGWEKMADFYCESGFSIYQWENGAEVTFQNIGRKVDLKKAMSGKNYGKIYLMLGMNDLGYGTTENFSSWVNDMIEMFEETNSQAVIYLMANLHISKEKEADQPVMNNINVNDKNVAIAQLADGKKIFYLDCNPLFTDAEGYLKADITFDGFHMHAENYLEWTDFIKQHAVVRK